MGSELIPSSLTYRGEVSNAASKENTTPFFGVSLNLPSDDFPNPCGLGLVLGLAWSCLKLMNLGPDFASTGSMCASLEAGPCKVVPSCTPVRG